MTDETSESTRPRTVPVRALRRHRALRRVGLVAIGVMVLAGLANLLGVRLGHVSASEGGTSLAVTYARVTRPGLATPWRVEVQRTGGFQGPITIATTSSYFDSFDFNQWYPEPASTSLRGDLLLLTFDKPQGEVLTLRFDGRATPTFGVGSRATTSIDTQGLPSLSVDYRTMVMP